MNTATLPRLRDGVTICPFDGGATQRFVVAVDGHHFVVAAPIAAILEEARSASGSDRALESVARRLSGRLGTCIAPAQLKALVGERIPKVLFEGEASVEEQSTPLLCQRLLLDAARLQPLLRPIARLFTVSTAALTCMLVALIDLFVAIHASQADLEPTTAADIATVLGLTLVGVFLHELGHLAACLRFGARHGGVGVGLYWGLPAFYAEVHGAWTLPRLQRAAVDAGGIYLQFLFCGALGLAYLASPSPALLHVIVVTHLLALHTLNPTLKFDGYWLLSDLAGIHNLHRRMRDLARHLLNGRAIARADALLLASFAAIALVYLIYLFAVVGKGLGVAAASLAAAMRVPESSLSYYGALLGKGAIALLLLAAALGTALMVSRASTALFGEDTHVR